MRIPGATALVTDAASGLGAGLVHALLARGAATVYAGARDPRTVAHQDPRVVPLLLDVTEPATVRAAAQRAGDVDLVVNDAWLGGNGTLLSGDPEWARAEMETTFWGPVTVLRAFAPVLARNGGGAAVTVLPAPSWPSSPATGSGRAAEAAAWSFTGSARAELCGQGTEVVGVHLDVPATAAEHVASQALDAVEGGVEEVLVGEPVGP
ncbi:SDR family NAD(P)-dependent oxidoreductase [Actinomycetospora sp. TBRC 11914]|uniref:SDR family NAD(P)-dependent oxidoreductase n=1 Tax=Actinomycetospora sp. TBRC 11914 TaxID=2729387 RepID=UPI00145F125A|nr:SDR family NAD(P)-dependent oxidoreductase [Actinomycetospora sp. TBRC 11914]NMO88537.1 SDR family NAD(P)-dependent oxidoreductase [Actinomycetospora sp. TBRC 11914]